MPRSTSPTTAPLSVISGPPLLPGFTAASVWMRVRRLSPSMGMVLSMPLTEPRVTVSGNASGNPIAATSSPNCGERAAFESRRLNHLMGWTADVLLGFSSYVWGRETQRCTPHVYERRRLRRRHQPDAVHASDADSTDAERRRGNILVPRTGLRTPRGTLIREDP